MSQGYILSRNSPWGYLLSVSAKDFAQKEADVRLRFNFTHIDAMGLVTDNYRPRFVLTGTVDAIEGELAPGVSSAQVDEPLELVVDYEPSDEEIAQLALKGFFSEQYPLQDLVLPPISVPCTIPILVFHGAETPVIQLALKSSDVVATNSAGIGRALAAEFPQYQETPHMEHEPYLVEEIPPRPAPHFSSEVPLQERELPAASAKDISPENSAQDIQDVLNAALAEMEQPPPVLAWEQPKESSASETELPFGTAQIAPVIPADPDLSDESEFTGEPGLGFGE